MFTSGRVVDGVAFVAFGLDELDTIWSQSAVPLEMIELMWVRHTSLLMNNRVSIFLRSPILIVGVDRILEGISEMFNVARNSNIAAPGC